MSRNVAVFAVLALALVGCSSDSRAGENGGSTTSGGAGSARCEVGNWVSDAMDAPAQAGIDGLAPTGGGDGMKIQIGADGAFQIDFGPMHPATGTFQSGGQNATLSTTFSGVGAGTWTTTGAAVGASFDDFTTVRTTVTITLGQTVPPVFDETLQQVNDNRMLGDQKVGVFALTDCSQTALTLTTPYPNGSLVVRATRAAG